MFRFNYQGRGCSSAQGVPGRFERIDEGQTFTVIVDYAYEPAALRKIFDAVLAVRGTAGVFTSWGCAGGRDVARRGIMGRMSGNTADICVVTNEDPYDEDPDANHPPSR